MLTFRSKSIGQGVKPKLVQVAVFSMGLMCTALALKREEQLEISVDGQPSPSSNTFDLTVGEHDVTCAVVGFFPNSTSLNILVHVQLADNDAVKAVGDKAFMSIKSGDNLTYRATRNFRLNVTMLTNGIVCSEGSETVRPIRVNIKPYSCNTSSVTIKFLPLVGVTATKTIQVTVGSVHTVLCQSFVHCTQVGLASVNHPLHFQVEVGGQPRKAKTVIALENYQDHAASRIAKTPVYLGRQGFNITLGKADDGKEVRCKDVISVKTSTAVTLNLEGRHGAKKRQADPHDDNAASPAETRVNKTTITRTPGSYRSMGVVVGSGIGGASGFILLAWLVFCCCRRANAADPKVNTYLPKTPGPAAATPAAPAADAVPAAPAATDVVVVVDCDDAGGGAPEPSAAPPAPATAPAKPDAADDAAIRESQGAEAEVGVTEATSDAVE